MKITCYTLLAASVLLWPEGAYSAPLFEAQETLDVIVEAPIRKLSSQRKKKPEFEGTVRYTDADGTEHAFAVIVSTRGKSRLDVCDYPPLRIAFNRDETAGTVFEGQRKLKMVRQCMRGGKGTNWLYLELGIYRAYNVITDYSYLTRQLNVTFRESGSGKSDGRVYPAFFIEDDKDMARRLNRKRIRPPKVEPHQMAAVETAHNLLFQYLIGNTDFAVKKGPSGEGCCHNGRVITEAAQRDGWIIVPYDFDYAGIINTEYAMVHERLPIRDVKTRLYRGFCWQNEEILQSIELFKQKRSDIESALLPSEVSKSKARRVTSYIERFYETMNDPQKLQKELFDKCRGPDSLPIRDSAVSPRDIKTP
jgi:hypothetical protein